MTHLHDMSVHALTTLQQSLQRDMELQKGNRLALDLTRGKPAPDQLDLSNGLEDSLGGNYRSVDGTDTRN